MKKHLLVVFAVFLFFGIGKLIGQKEIKNYELNQHLSSGATLAKEGNFEQAIEEFKLAFNDFKKNKYPDGMVVTNDWLKKCFQNLGQLDSAKIYIENALKIYELSPDAQFTYPKYEILNELGSVLSRMNKYDESSRCLKRAIELNPKKTQKDFKKLATCYVNLGTIETEQGKTLEGIQTLQKALKILQENGLGETQSAGIIYSNTAVELNRMKKHFEAIEYFEKALAIYERINGPLPLKGDSYSGLSKAYFDLQEYDKSYEIAQKLLEADKTVYGKNHPYLAQDYILLASLAKKRNPEQYSFEEEIGLLNNAYQIFLNSLGEKHTQTAGVIATIGRTYAANKQFDKAIEYGMKSLEIIEELVGNRSSTIFSKQELLANTYEEARQPEKALNIWQEQLISSTSIFSDKDFKALPPLKDITNSLQALYACNKKSSILLKMGAPENLQLIKNNSIYGDQILKKFIISEPDLKSKKTALESYGTENYENGLSASYQAFYDAQTTTNAEACFKFGEQIKSLLLLTNLVNSEAKEFNKIPTETLSKEKKYLFELHKLEKEIIANSDNEINLKLLREKHFDTKEIYNKFLYDIEKNYPDYYQNKFDIPQIESSIIAKTLKENELFISYSLNSKLNELYVFFIRKNQLLQIKKIPLSKDTEKRVENFNRRLQKSTMARNTSREKFIRESHELYKQFLQPIEDQLVGKDRIIIIGDGMTNYIPFEVLLKSDEIKPFNELDFLVKNHEISYHYSATLFAKAKEKEANQNKGIYAFAPVYEYSGEPTVATRKTRSIAIDSTLRAYYVDGSFSPLPESEREVKSIMNLFEKSGKTGNQLDLKKDATEASLKSNLEKPFKYVHIAGHSFADLKNPKFSGIACFDQGADASDTNDGTLYTGEIYNISSKADLVTLSSCESGFGKLEKTEGFLGLNRAFIYAGAPNVVFSLWKVYDKISAQMMTDFYKNVLGGKTYSASLREAKLELLKKEETASPHFWSPFLLIGR